MKLEKEQLEEIGVGRIHRFGDLTHIQWTKINAIQLAETNKSIERNTRSQIIDAGIGIFGTFSTTPIFLFVDSNPNLAYPIAALGLLGMTSLVTLGLRTVWGNILKDERESLKKGDISPFY